MSLLEKATGAAEHTDVLDARWGERPRKATVGWQFRYVRSVIGVDLLVATVLGIIAFYVRFGINGWLPVAYLFGTVALPVVWAALLGLARAYEARFLFTGTEEFRRVVIAGGTLLIGIALVSYAGSLEVARSWVLLTVPPVTLCSLATRYALRKRLHRARATRGAFMYRTVLVGHEPAVADFARTLRVGRYHGLQVVGACLPEHRPDGSPATVDGCDLSVLGTFGDAAAAVERVEADVVVVLACPELDGPVLRRLGWQLEKSGTDLLVAPALVEVAGPRVSVRPVADLPLLHVEHSELTGWRRLLKASFDRVGAALSLALASPLLMAIAVAVKVGDGGPVFFRQTRVGYEGVPFDMIKFRTMHVHAEDQLDGLLALDEGAGALFKLRRDPRVTRTGEFLRRFSLDELPQLVNVIRGQMSLVGPRPPLPREVEQYERDLHRRFAVRPGMTGLWQVSGRSDLAWEEAVRLDIRYVERWSLLLDALIISRTIGAVLRKSGAY